MEQNYRCTGNILKAANAVIKNNEVKYKKELWTNNEVGQLPKIYSAKNEYDEGSFIVQQINHLKTEEYFKTVRRRYREQKLPEEAVLSEALLQQVKNEGYL